MIEKCINCNQPRAAHTAKRGICLIDGEVPVTGRFHSDDGLTPAEARAIVQTLCGYACDLTDEHSAYAKIKRIAESDGAVLVRNEWCKP